jgi:hypothetical protein
MVYIFAIQDNAAFDPETHLKIVHPVQSSQEGGFPRARRTNNPEYLVGGDIQSNESQELALLEEDRESLNVDFDIHLTIPVSFV